MVPAFGLLAVIDPIAEFARNEGWVHFLRDVLPERSFHSLNSHQKHRSLNGSRVCISKFTFWHPPVFLPAELRVHLNISD